MPVIAIEDILDSVAELAASVLVKRVGEEESVAKIFREIFREVLGEVSDTIFSQKTIQENKCDE